ncbi:type VI secretion system baseplate subunit TssF [Bellilinea caldifistulae]|uniref:type VI secretion system baseplate subunit TssF n=1 Tax=Bellilinea caldifistulae TaxID=360411 RepID=UPI0011AEA05D|nr:type VI secretion system baseplate subunit TssF [Bellilinea caldifistulae]
MTEFLGDQKLEMLLQAMPADRLRFDLESLHEALRAAYGSQSAAGILVRAGRAAFARLLLKFAAELGFEDQGFRLLAPRRKMGVALQNLADWLQRQGAGRFEVRRVTNGWQWLHRVDFEGQTDNRATMACPFLLGMLQELSYWVSSGRIHPIREEAHSQGCLLEIESKPLD